MCGDESFLPGLCGFADLFLQKFELFPDEVIQIPQHSAAVCLLIVPGKTSHQGIDMFNGE
jgi:hypothetical protein